jgi:hypothetical protein
VGNTEIQATATRKHFAANRAIHRVGIITRLLLGEVDADLHRPTGVHRVETIEQRPSHWHHADEVIENRTEFFFAARGIQSVAVTFAIG